MLSRATLSPRISTFGIVRPITSFSCLYSSRRAAAMASSQRAHGLPFTKPESGISKPLTRTSTASTIPGPEIEARNTFTYAPLNSETSIRILTLAPGARGDPLIARLSNEELEDLEAPYEAISYVWGTGPRCSELRCHDGYGCQHDEGSTESAADDNEDGSTILPLTQSIDDALERLRLPDRPRRLWADQICINQADVAERSQQVRLMNEIYRGAARVLVWLGRDEEGIAQDAVRMVNHLHGVFQDEAAHDAFRRAYSEELISQSEEPWVPLSKLTKLPWFTRVWIVQEIGTSTPATLFWGEAEVDWDELSSVAIVLNVNYHYLRTRFQVFTPGIGYLYQRFVKPEAEDNNEFYNRGNFVYELHRARHLAAKDPRDHVYAFLGHFSIHKTGAAVVDDDDTQQDDDEQGLGLAGIEPDYSRPIADVFTDVAIRGLVGANTLILLSACHSVKNRNRKARTFRQRLELPSWVPDWRILPLHIIGSPDTPHRAAGDTRPRLEIDREKNLLHIHGVRVDTVSHVSSPFHGKSFQMPNTSASLSSTALPPSSSTTTIATAAQRNSWPQSLPLQEIWTEVCGLGSTFTLEEGYVDGRSSALLALMQTLTNGCIGAERARKHLDAPETDWFANGAAYLNSTHVTGVRDGDSDNGNGSTEMDIAPELEELARSGTPYKWSHEATLVARYRRFGVTETGYFVLGPDVMQTGDVVVVFHGGRTPFILRPTDQGWALLGECYMHGMMNGEAMERGIDEEIFTIS